MSRNATFYLSEEQNASFDAEYHSKLEVGDKLSALHEYFKVEEKAGLRILDVGGGNGQFLDTVLDYFQSAVGTLIDISPMLINANLPHPRKCIIHGDLYNINRLLKAHGFDMIFINWVLHHLVGDTYDDCTRRAVLLLQSLRSFITERGLIIIAENLYDGWFQSNTPSKLIFAITSISNPLMVAATRRIANTAGVGVCFRSERAWSNIFSQCGFEERIGRKYGDYWNLPVYIRIGLTISKVRHGHFFIAPKARQVSALETDEMSVS